MNRLLFPRHHHLPLLILHLLCQAGLPAAASSSSPERYYDEEELKPCPSFPPDHSIDISKLGGRWQLSLLVLDANTEDLEEKTACLTGEVTLLNSTHLRQTWEMFSPYLEAEPTATFELVSGTLEPGLWAVHTPLGGTMTGRVLSSGEDHVLISHCGWTRGSEVHLWTAGVTRSRLRSPLRRRLSRALLTAGFSPSRAKIITWNHC